jgi:hypothetical protein
VARLPEHLESDDGRVRTALVASYALWEQEVKVLTLHGGGNLQVVAMDELCAEVGMDFGLLRTGVGDRLCGYFVGW